LISNTAAVITALLVCGTGFVIELRYLEDIRRFASRFAGWNSFSAWITRVCRYGRKGGAR
jgi:hypothetical protein